MEIRRYYFYILINCALFLSSTLCKPVSLNDIIAAEERSAALQTPQLKVSETKITSTREIPRKHKILTLTKHITSGSLAQTGKISPLKYRKTYQIRTPLRPRRIKYSYKPRSQRINSAAKREIDNYETLNRNYIPLLKSLSLLFNNILRTDSRDVDDTDEFYDNQHSISRSEECTCARKPKYETIHGKSSKKAIVITPSISTKIPAQTKTINLTETSSPSAHNTFNDNISTFGWNKNVPVLSAGNSTGSWRNHNGFGKGSLSTYNRNIEGHIPRNNGNDENNNSGRKTTESYTKDYKQYTFGSSGHDASCNGSCREIRRNGYNTSKTDKTPTVETIFGSNETFRNDRGDSNQFKGFDNFETRRNKTESRILLSESSSRLRRLESQEETTDILWQIESPKENSYDVTYNFTRNQRLSNRDGPVAPEDQKIRRPNQKLTLEDLTTSSINTSTSNVTHNKDKQKIVVIYDGYSIARDVNGANKLTEKAYRIHSFK